MTITSFISFYMRLFYAITTSGLSYICIHQNNEIFISNILTNLANTDVLFVKILQAVSYSYDFINKDIHEKITDFTDNAPYTEEDVDNSVILHVEHLGFTFCDAYPIKSGMISLIYLIKDSEDKPYILKMKRYDIEERLEICITNMRLILYFISLVTNIWFNIDITNTIDRHLLLLKEQVDFKNEIKNTKSIAENFQYIDYVKIPIIYDDSESNNENCIIMEFIQGRHLSQIKEHEYDVYCDLVAKMGMTSLFIHGESHGDLHPGNILFIHNDISNKEEDTPEYQIGLIDFGLTIKISSRMMDTMTYAALNYRKKHESSTIVHKYLNATLEPENIINDIHPDAKDRILSELESILTNISENNINCSQEQFYKSFQILNNNLVCNVSEKYDIKMTDDFVKIQVASSMSNGMAMKLCKGDYNKQMDKTVAELFHLDLLDDSD